MAQSKHQHNKRHKELARKQKKEDKRQRKLDKESSRSVEDEQQPQDEVVGVETPLSIL